MREILKKLQAGNFLSSKEMQDVLASIVNKESNISSAEIGAFLFGTSLRLPSYEELFGAVSAMRKVMIPVSFDGKDKIIIDTCGTGGSGLDTFNTSTVAGLICSACGLVVAKHGNRAVSGVCGSADLLQALGAKIELSPEIASRVLEEIGFCFLFAPMFHPATSHVASIRRTLGIRTIFNFLGPLLNPAPVSAQLIGVCHQGLLKIMGDVAVSLGIKNVAVVSSEEGLDEVSISSNTKVYSAGRDGESKFHNLAPSDFGIAKVSYDLLKVKSKEEALLKAKSVLKGEGRESALENIVIVNAAMALVTSGKCDKVKEALEHAKEALYSGLALKVLENYIQSSNES